MESEPRHIVCVTGLVRDSTGRILLVQNRRGWEMPGGQVEIGDPIFAMHAGMVSAVFNDTNGAKVSRALDSLRAALSEPQVDR